jgi:hypothetical protein
MIFADNFVVTQAPRLGSTDSASLASGLRRSPLDFCFRFLYFFYEMQMMIAKPYTTSASSPALTDKSIGSATLYLIFAPPPPRAGGTRRATI